MARAARLALASGLAPPASSRSNRAARQRAAPPIAPYLAGESLDSADAALGHQSQLGQLYSSVGAGWAVVMDAERIARFTGPYNLPGGWCLSWMAYRGGLGMKWSPGGAWARSRSWLACG
jgi:hypothetical protein